MKKNRKKWLAVLTVGAMVITSFNMPFAETESKAAGYGISNPRVEKDVLISGDDSEKPEGTISNPVVKADVTTWDCITFGNYWQEDTNGDGKVDQTDEKQPIKWRILSVDGDDAFLLADQNLDCQPYNTDDTVVTWENCSLRKWLNKDFLKAAFTEEEQNAILETEVINENYNTEKENITKDKIYLLSKTEACDKEYGFNIDIGTNEIPTRESKNTDYVRDSGALHSDSPWCQGNGWWWLRTPANVNNVFSINMYGYIYEPGYLPTINNYGVRPVLHLNIASSYWKKEETRNTCGVYQSVWDCVTLGKYWQEDTNGDGKVDQTDEKQPIKWRVLAVDGDELLLLADKNLDNQKYNSKSTSIAWNDCTLRKWLNDTFLEDAFSSVEQQEIHEVTIINKDNPQYKTKGGEDTTDKIFLLSIEEASKQEYGFDIGFDKSRNTRSSESTNYVRQNGDSLYRDRIYGYWWLRSPGMDSRYASIVSSSGYAYCHGASVSEQHVVRPALYINQSSPALKYAGKVNSNIEIQPTLQPTKAPQVTKKPNVLPTVSPMATATTTPQPATTSGNTGNQASRLPQQQSTPQAGENTDTTADTNAKVSLIKQSKVSWKTAKNIKGKKLTANWKKTLEADGYQIQYAPNKKFKKAKSKTVKSTSVTLKKLKKKTTYFVRVRAYKTADGKKVYGKWSSVKKVKIKK